MWGPGMSGVLMTCEVGVMGIAVKTGKAFLFDMYDEWKESEEGLAWAAAHPQAIRYDPTVDTEEGAEEGEEGEGVEEGKGKAEEVMAEAAAEAAGEAAGGEKVMSMEEALNAEFEEMDQVDRLVFRNLETGVKGTFFIKTQEENSLVTQPDGLVKYALDRVGSSGQNRTRYISRVFPILTTCSAKIPVISVVAKQMLATYMGEHPELAPGSPISIVVRRRMAQDDVVGRDDLVNTMVGVVRNAGLDLQWKCKTHVIYVDIVMTMAALTVMEGWGDRRKYNIQQIASAGASRLLDTTTTSRVVAAPPAAASE